MPNTLVEALDNLYTTTWQLRRKGFVDNVFQATPFWFWLTQNGRRRSEQGGRRIEIPLMYGKNETVTTFDRGDTFTLSDPQILTVAWYPWRYVAGSIVRYWADDQKNRGKAAIMNLLNAKIENLRLSMIDKMEELLFQATPGAKDPNSLLTIIRPQAPTAAGQDVVGGIDAYTDTWWQNKRKQASGPFSTDGIADMRNLFNTCSNGNDTPDFILTDQQTFEAYEGELLEIHRIVDKRLADAGFENLTFKGKPITWAPRCPAGHMFFINSKYLEWVYDEFANFDMTEWKPVQNSLDRAAQVVLAGNLVVSNRARQGVLYGITY